jgi:hypothetical protein
MSILRIIRNADNAILMSVHGTFETCRPASPTSVDWGRPEIIGASSNRRE